MSWSDAELRRLGEMIDAGLSSRNIARAMRRPSGTVQGMAWRLGWSFGRPRSEAEKLAPTLKADARREARLRAPLAACRPKRAGHNVNIWFDDETYAQIHAMARKDRLSRAQIVRELVEWGLETVRHEAAA